MEFKLQVVNLADIGPRADLLAFKTPTYNFMEELELRVQEREESFNRGIPREPLLITSDGMELMDGYTRYMVFKKYAQKQVMAYIGTVVW